MKRNEVKTEYKWKVEDIFTTDEEWEKEFSRLEKNIDFSRYAGKLSDSETLLKFFKADDEFGKAFDKVAVYASMKHDEDSAVSKYAAYDAKVYSLYTKYATEQAFFSPEMAKQSDEYLASLLKDKRFADYDYILKRIIKGKPHTVSEQEEKLVSMAGEVFYNFRETFSMIDNLEVPLPEIEFGGDKAKLSHGLYGIILRCDDRDKRKENITALTIRL